ncbi:hypothetical protein VIBNI_A3084 [Vibrio nigripulchritudo]|uniref:Uncharacterized protein n=1 Tax=Vibrio nigripulchritudo TaxID=28173 RepID=U4KGY8_9VIBR|nr:hypothetical protein [Vibrio nigripulchritudo]CCO59104.1 hypothetical protein VIBNI_A3084 [Vibrio nigripulchritudo]
MPRPLRFEYEDAVYHVMNRGRGVSVFSMAKPATKPLLIREGSSSKIWVTYSRILLNA